MESIWGLSTNYKPYSIKAIDKFNEKINGCRIIFRQEFRDALDNYHSSELYDGSRFSDNSRILWALQSKVDEEEFLNYPNHYIIRVLLGACSSDYYYRFEKQW